MSTDPTLVKQIVKELSRQLASLGEEKTKRVRAKKQLNEDQQKAMNEKMQKLREARKQKKENIKTTTPEPAQN